MPKYRKLPLTVIDSLDMADMPDDFTRLTWLMLPLIVCKNGRAVDLPQWLVSKLYPARTDVDAGMIAAAMDWYESRKMIRRYEVDGRAYFELVNWTKHQGDTSREGESPYPDPPTREPVQTDERDTPDPTRELVVSNSGLTHEQVTTNSRSIQGNTNTMQGQGNGAGAREAAPPKPPPKKSPPPSRKKQPDAKTLAHGHMINALGEVCGMSPYLNFDKLSDPAAQLIDAGYTEAQVRSYYSRPDGWWYQRDWRGQKGEYPRPAQVIETIYGAVEQSRPTRNEGGKLWLDHIKVFNSASTE